MRINDIGFIGQLPGPASIKPNLELSIDEQPVDGSGTGFSDAIRNSWEKFGELSAESKESTAMLLTGQLDDLSGHLVAGEKAGLQFELNLAVRTKLLDAYQEIMKTQI